MIAVKVQIVVTIQSLHSKVIVTLHCENKIESRLNKPLSWEGKKQQQLW